MNMSIHGKRKHEHSILPVVNLLMDDLFEEMVSFLKQQAIE